MQELSDGLVVVLAVSRTRPMWIASWVGSENFSTPRGERMLFGVKDS